MVLQNLSAETQSSRYEFLGLDGVVNCKLTHHSRNTMPSAKRRMLSSSLRYHGHQPVRLVHRRNGKKPLARQR